MAGYPNGYRFLNASLGSMEQVALGATTSRDEKIDRVMPGETQVRQMTAFILIGTTALSAKASSMSLDLGLRPRRHEQPGGGCGASRFREK